MHNQLTISSSVLPSCAQQNTYRRRDHQHTQQTSSSPSCSSRRLCRSWVNFGFKSFWVKCCLLRLQLRCCCGSVHVRALMKGVRSVKRYRKEGSERRLRGDAGFANKANIPHFWERAAPLPRPPPPDSGYTQFVGK